MYEFSCMHSHKKNQSYPLQADAQRNSYTSHVQRKLLAVLSILNYRDKLQRPTKYTITCLDHIDRSSKLFSRGVWHFFFMCVWTFFCSFVPEFYKEFEIIKRKSKFCWCKKWAHFFMERQKNLKAIYEAWMIKNSPDNAN